MIYHILNGDALADRFPAAGLPGEIIVAREALIEGDLSGNNLQEFWQNRAAYWGEPYPQYEEKVVEQIEKLLQAPPGSEFNLWFEYDLFCQVNMWFILSLLYTLDHSKNVFVVYTSHINKEDKYFWNGFGRATSADLKTCFEKRMQLQATDLKLGHELWLAFKNADPEKLKKLASVSTANFPYLPQVVEAHVARFPEDGEKGRPEKVIEEILTYTVADFNIVFTEFQKRESIYGFGDTQVKKLYDKVLANRQGL